MCDVHLETVETANNNFIVYDDEDASVVRENEQVYGVGRAE